MKNTSSSSGIGFCGLLQIAFIVLKLCHVIEWPWLWVLAPTWIGATFTVLVLIIGFVLFLYVGGKDE